MSVRAGTRTQQLHGLTRGIRPMVAETHGQSLVETALSLTIILCIVFTVVACSEAAYAKHYVAAAARQGTRYAIVRGSTFTGSSCNGAGYACQATAADIQTYVLSSTPPGLNAGSVKVTTAWPGLAASGLNCLTLNGTNSPGCDVQVTVSYSFTYKLPFVATNALTLQSTSTMPILE